MVSVRDDDFYVEDESPEELKRSLSTGETVLVIPSRLRRQMRHLLSELLHFLSDDLDRAAKRVGNEPSAGRDHSRSHHGGAVRRSRVTSK